MSNPNRLLALPFIGICVCIAFLFSSFNTHSEDAKQKPQKPETGEVDTSKFPLADLLAPEPVDPEQRAKRQAKGKKYNSNHSRKVERLEGIYVVNHSLPNLPALPIEKSAAVVVGEIRDANAYLSEDKTALYSEFRVTIQSILKNDVDRPISVGQSIEVQRYGGRLRLPSGKIIVASVDHQDMPQVGSRYVLFLTKQSQHEVLTILAGYELRVGKVFPLDRVRSWHPMAKYSGCDEATLLNDLFSILSNSSASSRLN